MGRTIGELSKETETLISFFSELEDGTELSYNEIQELTGIKMDNAGRAKLRTALKRIGKEYSAIHGYGLKLADAESSMSIVVDKLSKVDRAVKRGEKTHKNIQSQFFDSLSKEEQNQILYVGAVFGAIRVASENGRLIYASKKRPLGSTAYIQIPQFDTNMKDKTNPDNEKES